MPKTTALKSPQPTSKKRKSSLVSPPRSKGTPKKEDNKQMKLDCFFTKQKVRKVEEKLVKAKEASPVKVILDDSEESNDSSPIQIQQNVIIDELSSDSVTSLALSRVDNSKETSFEKVIEPLIETSDEEMIDSSPERVDNEVVMVEMSQTSNKLSVNSEDSMDLFNDDCYAQFCKTTESKPINFNFDNEFAFDFAAERRQLDEQRRDLEESSRIVRLNKELDEQIKKLEEETKQKEQEKVQQTPSRKQKMETMKQKLGEEGINNVDVSILDSQSSNTDFQTLYLYRTLPEEIQRFNIFNISKVLKREFKSGESFESISQSLDEYARFSVENYSSISKVVSHKLTIEQPKGISLLFKKFTSAEEFQTVLDDFGVHLTKQNEIFEVICPEEIVNIYSVLQTNGKTLSMLIKKMTQFQLLNPSNDISVFLITLFICSSRCIPQSMIKYVQGNIFNSSTVQISEDLKEIFLSSASNNLSHDSILADFNICMKGSLNSTNTNTIVEMLLEKFGYNSNVPSLNLSQVTDHSLLQTTKHYFPPCFSQFIQSKPWFNMCQAVRDLFKKMFMVILVQLTDYQSLTKETILSMDGIPSIEQIIPLLKHSLSFMQKLSEECPVGNNANFACLHMFQTILSMLQSIFDKPIPKNLRAIEQEFKQTCSSFSQSLSDILPIENYRFFAHLQLMPFIDGLFPSKVQIPGSGIVQKTLSSLIKKQ